MLMSHHPISTIINSRPFIDIMSNLCLYLIQVSYKNFIVCFWIQTRSTVVGECFLNFINHRFSSALAMLKNPAISVQYIVSPSEFLFPSIAYKVVL